MSFAAPGPLFLLLRHELRLYLRTGFLRKSSLTFLLISQALLHLFALMMVFLPPVPDTPAARERSLLLLASGLVGMLVFMVSRGLANAVQSLYTRGDLDLLLASPVDRRALIGVRTGTIALATSLEVAGFLWPFANVFVLFGRVQWFKAYLLVPGMAMLATSIALAVTLAAFRTIGPRRTRITVQVLAVLVGIGFTLVVYLPTLAQRSNAPRRPFSAGMEMLASQGTGFRDVLAAPAQWLLAGYVPLLVFVLAAAALFALTIHLTGDRVVQALTLIAGNSARVARRASAGVMRFRRSFRLVIVFKELKLLARDPFLIAQILQQSLVALPATFALWRAQSDAGMPLAWMSVILLGASIAGPLAWLTVVAEDAPDLLAAAPVSRTALVRAKIEAAMLPALPICLAPLPFLLATHTWFAICVSACAFGSALTAALLNMSNPVAKRRDSFKTRHQGSGWRGLLMLLQIALWMGLCVALNWLGNAGRG